MATITPEKNILKKRKRKMKTNTNDYIVELSEGLIDLSRMVTARMNDGYTPQGGIFALHFPKTDTQEEQVAFYQAMVRHEKP